MLTGSVFNALSFGGDLGTAASPYFMDLYICIKSIHHFFVRKTEMTVTYFFELVNWY